MRLAGFILLAFVSLPVVAQVDCNTLRDWIQLDNTLAMNQKHLFCGEWNKDRAKGFHSRPGGANPGTVSHFTVQDSANAAGIYTGRWSYQGQSGGGKFSSMFPDSCTVEQVLNSITYAANHQYKCPPTAPGWARCGPNQPVADTDGDENAKFCSVGNQRFTISFAPSRNGRINTAFPLFE